MLCVTASLLALDGSSLRGPDSVMACLMLAFAAHHAAGSCRRRRTLLLGVLHASVHHLWCYCCLLVGV
jgi:hypothetical protein